MRRICLLILILGFGLSDRIAQAQTKLEKYETSKEFFSSVVKVTICHDTSELPKVNEAVDQIWARFADIHWRLSVYDPQSDLNKINHSYPEAVTVGADTWGLIKDSIEYHKLSKGVFDITFSPLQKLWKASAKKNVLPTPEQIKEAKVKLGVENIQLQPNNQIRLLSPDTLVNIDSIADGYAADQAARILKEQGFQNFLVDTSGELNASGRNCEHKSWSIGIQDPRDKSKLVDVVQISNLSVTTSGNYEHNFVIQGVLWSHIFNPITGYSTKDVLSATVIAPQAQFSDFWSTALCILSPEQGVVLTDALGEGYASMVIVDKGEGQVEKKMSKNYPQFIRKE